MWCVVVLLQQRDDDDDDDNDGGMSDRIKFSMMTEHCSRPCYRTAWGRSTKKKRR